MNEFEQLLRSQKPRQIPASWRQEILTAARAATVLETSGIRHPASNALRAASPIFNFKFLIFNCLWPHPKAWAGLAAVWLVIGWLNWSAMRPDEAMMASHRSQPSVISPGQLASLTEQRRLQRELLGLIPVNADEPLDRPKPRPSLKPQSALTPDCGFA